MSRLNAYLNKDTMEREDVAFMIDDDAIDIRITRYVSLGDDDGFRKQTPNRDLRLVKVVKGRVDRKDAIYIAQKGEVSKSVDSIYIATVYYKNLQIDDVLEAAGQKYRVKFVNKVGQSFTEAEVEVQT